MDDDTIARLAWLDQEDRRVSDIIRAHGCFIQAVHPGEQDPGFAYTVGLFGIGHPELIVFGLGLESAAFVLNGFFDGIRDGRDLIAGELVGLPGCDTRFFVEPLPNPGEILYSANRHYQRPAEVSVPAYQLTWDVAEAFPWDPNYPYSPDLQPRPGSFGPA